MAMKKIFISFAIAGLFVIAFMSFIANTQTNYGLDETIRDDATLNKTLVNLGTNFDSYDEDAEDQSLAQDNDDPKTEGGSLLFLSITKTGKVIKGMVTGVYNILVVIPSNLLGFPRIIMIVLTSIVSIILVLSAWRLYKAGE